MSSSISSSQKGCSNRCPRKPYFSLNVRAYRPFRNSIPVESVSPGLDQQVVVRAHQAPRVTDPLSSLHRPLENLEEGEPIVVVVEDRAAAVAARPEVIHPIGDLQARWSRHRPSVDTPRRTDGRCYRIGTRATSRADMS